MPRNGQKDAALKRMDMKKWQYLRDEVDTVDELDEKLKHWGSHGWELASLVHAKRETTTTEETNILAPEVWMLVLKQPSP